MTQEDQRLADDKMRAELYRLMEETINFSKERAKTVSETEKTIAEIKKINADVTDVKIGYVIKPMLAGSALTGAIVALFKLVGL
ncbi:MAG: hypothetical protein GDA39_07385 [Hyphomonadaceae bacterium]|nr:hypothetical protein [Hyphomonadaceae bacterium]MBC6412697.1 hypothetical protein [Hyphomonadaceae bacterium]